VSGAAETLHVTQPGLSRQLRQLERQLGIPLFDRNAGRLTLSAPAETYCRVFTNCWPTPSVWPSARGCWQLGDSIG